MIHRCRNIARGALLILLAAGFAASPTFAVTVINVPPSPSPESAGADTVVNLLPGGTLANFFQALNGSILNIQGGTASTAIAQNGSLMNMTSGQAANLVGNSGSQLKISGGRVTGQVEANSIVDIEGGRINLLADFSSTANITISGGAIERIDVRSSPIAIEGVNFAINGIPVTGLNSIGDSKFVLLPVDSVLTATLADGRAIGHYYSRGFTEPFEVTLTRAAAPPPPSPAEIHVTNNPPLEWIGAGQRLFVETGGIVNEHFRSGPGNSVKVNGGSIREAYHAVSTQLDLNSGTIARRSKFFDNSVVNVNGGTLEDDSRFLSGSTLNVYGGHVEGAVIHQGASGNIYGGSVYRMISEVGGTTNVYGGTVNNVDANEGGIVHFFGGNIVDQVSTSGGVIHVHGGSFSDFFDLRGSSQLTIYANELRRNGVPITGLANPGDLTTITVGAGDFISGVFESGLPFVLGGESYNLPSSVKLARAAAYSPGPSTFLVPPDPAPQGVHDGQTLTLNQGGSLAPNFTAGYGSHVVIQGGSVGNNFEAIGATVDATAGSVGLVDAFADAVVNIGGNTQFGILSAYQKGTINVTGGSGTDTIRTTAGGKLNFSGGNFNGIIIANGGEINISGGTISMYQLESTITNKAKVNFTGGSVNGLLVSDGATIDVTGGTLGHLQTAGGNVQAKINGGKVRWLAAAYDSTVDVISGNVGDTDASYDSKLRIRGGALGDSHEWSGGSVEMYGYDFKINGTPVAGLAAVNNAVNVNIPSGSTFSGTLSDGTPFYIAPDDNFQSVFVASGVLRLIRTAIPITPTLVQVPGNPAPYGAGAGQKVVVDVGGALDENFVAGRDSVVEIHGGTVGDNFEAVQSQVAITGGTVGNRLDVFSGAVVTLSDGSIGEEFEVFAGGVLNIQGGAAGKLSKAVGGVVNMSGGSLGTGFDALANSVVNISGGTVASEFFADQGSTVNVSGGQTGTSFEAGDGSHVNVSGGHLADIRVRAGATVDISGGNTDNLDGSSANHLTIRGGSFGDNFDIGSTADANMQGQNFELDGVPIAGLDTPGNQVAFNLASNRLFTGTLADGTPFAFRTNEGDAIGSVKLIRSADVAAGPAVVDVSTAENRLGIRAGQTLNLNPGGSLASNFNAGRGSVVNILGGSIGENFEAFASTVNVESGNIGANFDAFAGSQINVHGGTIGTNFDVYALAAVNVGGGTISRLDALADSNIRVDDGSITSLQATTGSHTIWKGGTIGGMSVSGTGTTLAMHGVDFQVNGVPVAGLANVGDSVPLNLASGSILTATLANGTSVVLFSHVNNPLANAQISNGALTLVRSATPTLSGPAFQHVSGGDGPFWIGSGQTVLLDAQGKLPANFAAGPGSTVEFNGASIGTGLKAIDADIIINGGNVGTSMFAVKGTELKINGGTFAGGFSLDSASHAFIRGGTVPVPLLLNVGTIVDIYGTSFLFNNQPIGGLGAPGSFAVITQRNNQVLSGFLADGKRIEWRMTALSQLFGMSSQATVRVNIVPEPAALFLVVQVLLATGMSCRRMRRPSILD